MTLTARLRELAQKATPGPWERPIDFNGWVWSVRGDNHICSCSRSPNPENNALYIAALWPEVVLALCDCVERGNECRDRLTAHDYAGDSDFEAAEAFDAALARLAQLEQK